MSPTIGPWGRHIEEYVENLRMGKLTEVAREKLEALVSEKKAQIVIKTL